MPGWRMGFAVGNERVIAALGGVKSYLDYGAFTPIQVAATAALNGPDDCIREMRETYKRRRNVLVKSFGRAGWEIPPSARLHVRLGAHSRGVSEPRQRGVLHAPGREGGSCGLPRGSVWEDMEKATYASRSSKTSSTSASGPQYPPVPETGPQKVRENVLPLAQRR